MHMFYLSLSLSLECIIFLLLLTHSSILSSSVSSMTLWMSVDWMIEKSFTPYPQNFSHVTAVVNVRGILLCCNPVSHSFNSWCRPYERYLIRGSSDSYPCFYDLKLPPTLNHKGGVRVRRVSDDRYHTIQLMWLFFWIYTAWLKHACSEFWRSSILEYHH